MIRVDDDVFVMDTCEPRAKKIGGTLSGTAFKAGAWTPGFKVEVLKSGKTDVDVTQFMVNY